MSDEANWRATYSEPVGVIEVTDPTCPVLDREHRCARQPGHPGHHRDVTWHAWGEDAAGEAHTQPTMDE